MPSVLASTYVNKRIIVADNASTDDSLQWLKEQYPSVEILTLPTNFGFAKGYNEALKLVDSEYYVLLNSDVEVTPGWIEPIISLMQSDRAIAACQPKMLSFKDKHMFEYAGASGGWIDPLGYPFSRGRVFDVCETDDGQYDTTSRVFWASGAAFFVKSEVYHEMHGFDEFFFAHQEEIDLCWRMQLNGYAIMACPASVVYHVGGGTLARGEQKAYLNFRNNLVMVYKNWSLAEKIWKLPLRILLDCTSAMKAFITGDYAFGKGVFRAEAAFLHWLIGNKSGNVFSEKRSGQLHGVYHGSLILQYFIKKKRLFNEIVLHEK